MNIKLELNEHIDKFKSDENYFQFFRELALEYLNSDPVYVKYIMELLSKICIEKKYVNAYSWCILYMGWAENTNGNINNAIALHKKSMAFFENNNNSVGYAAVYNALLVDYVQIGYLELSIENGMKGIEFCKQINNINAMTALMINTAAVYVEYENYDEALNMMSRITEYKYEYRADYEIEMNIISAQCYLGKHCYDKADECCKRAFNLVKENKFVQWENKVLMVMAKVHSAMDEHENWQEYFYNALMISEGHDNFYMQGSVLLSWGICELEHGNYEKAENIFIDAECRIKDREYILMKERLYYYISILNERCNNFEKAYKYLKISVEYKNILKNDSEMKLKKLKEKNMAYAVQEYKSLYDKIERISDLGKNITSNLDIEKCTDIIYEEIEKLVPVDSFAIGIYEKDKEILNYNMVFRKGKRVDGFLSRIEEGKSLGAYCFYNKTDILISNMEREYSKYIYKMKLEKEKLDQEAKSIIFIPLLVGNEPVGVMTVQSNKVNAYNVNDFNELKILSSYIVIAIKNLQLFNKVKYFAEYDILTECYNRNKILYLGNNMYDFNMKNRENMCVGMVDIDNFKSINDTYGHGAGDKILKNIARIMKANITSDDYVGRYGGEEFLIIFNKKNIIEAGEICEKLRSIIEVCQCDIGEKSISTTASMGVFEFNDNIGFLEGIKIADKRLYIAKEKGKNMIIKNS